MKLLLNKKNSNNQTKASVYMTKDISAEGLMAIYEELGRKATGKVAVKISRGGTRMSSFSSAQIDCTISSVS